jgi:GNAT superfamily N-acetyltransferase
MRGGLTLCNTRAPSFFALHRLESLGHRGAGEVLVVDADLDSHAGDPVGSIAWTERRSYLHGQPRATAYICDLKVHPSHRGGALADALATAVRERARAFGGDDLPGLLTILGGNAAMARRLDGPRGLPRLHPFAELCATSLPFLPRRRTTSNAALTLAPATAADLPEMGALWDGVAPGRQFAQVFERNDGGEALWRFIAQVPGLRLDHHWLARDRRGRLCGFLGLWDADAVKQTVVVRYGRRLAWFRRAWNALVPLWQGPRLPPAGHPLHSLSALNVCVPADRPDVLNALVQKAQHARGPGYVCVNLGLDRRDPLRAGLRGLHGQTTAVTACVTTAAGTYRGPALDDRPLHFEIAFV